MNVKAKEHKNQKNGKESIIDNFGRLGPHSQR